MMEPAVALSFFILGVYMSLLLMECEKMKRKRKRHYLKTMSRDISALRAIVYDMRDIAEGIKAEMESKE